MILLQNTNGSTSAALRVFRGTFKQWRTNTLWATKRERKTSKDLALEYFDNIYGPLFGKRWPSIRLALLSPHKYCAVVNNNGDVDNICTQLQNKGAVNIREVFDIRKRTLLEEDKTDKRQKNIRHVYDLDKKIEAIAAKTRDEEIGKLYSNKKDWSSTDGFSDQHSNKQEENLQQKELIKQAKTSLEESIAEATIDMNRQIDPSEGLSSSRLNEFVPVSKLKGKEGFVSEADHFSFYNDVKDFPVTVEPDNLIFPPHLQIYTFDQGNISAFSPAKSGATCVLDYYLMGAGSILPVLALGLEPGDTVLDMCAAPGGKSLLCLQTLYPGILSNKVPVSTKDDFLSLIIKDGEYPGPSEPFCANSIVCNDSSLSRLNRLQNVMNEFFYDWKKKVTLLNTSGVMIQEMNSFSKILVDAPCTNDRLSVNEDDNNIFKPSRNKERILLPQLQVELLFHALKLVKTGGSVVYSTCSLNPAQNDGVVHMALRKVWEETSMKIVVKDFSEALEPAKVLFKFASPNVLRYGSLVVPYLPSNFGPMYFCKLEKKQ